MKIIQSFWTGGNDCLKNSFGWLSPVYNFLSWIISCNQLRCYYDDVILVTDRQGYDMLINKLRLPYTDAVVSLDDLNGYNPNLWALAKIKAYQTFDTPFIHVDGDVFIWTKIDKNLKGHDLIVQNIETTSAYYGNMWNYIRPSIDYMPEVIKRFDLHIDSKAYNMGIFGGTDINFIQHYAKEAFAFVDNNLEKVNKLENTNFNIFFEQVLLYEMAKKEKKSTSCFINEDIGDNQYHDFANFDEVPDKRNYLHLLGFYKKQLQICKKMESYVIRFYPEYYKRLEDLLQMKELLGDVGFEYNTDNATELEREYVKDIITGRKQTSHSSAILKRELVSVHKSRILKDYLSQGDNFFILPTTGFYLKGKQIIVESLHSIMLTFPSLKIDHVIFKSIDKGCDKHTFEENAMKYLDESFPEEKKQNFIQLLWNRIFILVGIGVLVPVSAKKYRDTMTKEKQKKGRSGCL
ncbi:MAG: DUF6734 family protein [Bacteroidaceae bacterium]